MGPPAPRGARAGAQPAPYDDADLAALVSVADAGRHKLGCALGLAVGSGLVLPATDRARIHIGPQITVTADSKPLPRAGITIGERLWPSWTTFFIHRRQRRGRPRVRLAARVHPAREQDPALRQETVLIPQGQP